MQYHVVILHTLDFVGIVLVNLCEYIYHKTCIFIWHIKDIFLKQGEFRKPFDGAPFLFVHLIRATGHFLIIISIRQSVLQFETHQYAETI